jgi:hypothetical protein
MIVEVSLTKANAVKSLPAPHYSGEDDVRPSAF